MSKDERPKKVFALVNIETEGLGKAASLFVETMSAAIQGIAAPWQTRRMADANADAKMAEAMADIRITSSPVHPLYHHFHTTMAKTGKSMVAARNVFPLGATGGNVRKL